MTILLLIQAYFRAAKAAFKLSDHVLCEQLCAEGLDQDPASAEFTSLQKQAKDQRLKKEAEDRALREKEEKILGPARKLAAAIVKVRF